MPLVDYSRTRRPVLDVDLDVAPYDRWQEVGRRHKAALSRFMREIETTAAEAVVARPPAWVRRLIGGAGRVTGTLAALVARLFGEDYQAEIRGLAHASGLPAGKLFLANLIYDLSVGREGFRGACSSFSLTVDRAPVLFRTMDWDLPASTGRHTVMTRFHKGRSSYVNIAPLGCVGVLSAMRAGAWAVTLNQAPANGLPRVTQWPAMHRLRAACDASLTFPALVRRIGEYQTMTAFFAHAVGTKPVEQVVVESYADSFHRRRPRAGGPLIQTNHYVSAHGRHLNPSAEIDENGEEWDTYPRYEALARRLRGARPDSLAAGLTTLSRGPVTHSSTMNQMALCPATGEAIVRVRT